MICLISLISLISLKSLIYWKSEKHQWLTDSLIDNFKSRDASASKKKGACDQEEQKSLAIIVQYWSSRQDGEVEIKEGEWRAEEHKEEEKSLVTETKPPNQLLLVARGGEAFLCVLHNIVLIPKIRVSSSYSLIILQKKIFNSSYASKWKCDQ